MPVTPLPYRLDEYISDLTAQQIGESLDERVLTSFSLFDLKPYYGGFTSHSFSVRRTRSRFKKESLAPGVEGTYDARRGGGMRVTLSLTPHPVLLGVFLFLFCAMVLLWALGLPEALRTRDLHFALGGLIPAAVIYGGFWTVFQFQCVTDLRFWKHALRLRELPA